MFLIFLLETLWAHLRTASVTEAVLTSIHNLCFGSKIRKLCIPLGPKFYYVKVVFTGVYIARTCYPDAINGLFLTSFISVISVIVANFNYRCVTVSRMKMLIIK